MAQGMYDMSSDRQQRFFVQIYCLSGTPQAQIQSSSSELPDDMVDYDQKPNMAGTIVTLGKNMGFWLKFVDLELELEFIILVLILILIPILKIWGSS